MEKKNKIILIASIIIIITSIIVSILMLTKKDNDTPPVIEGINLPQDKDILKDAKLNELDITDVSLLTREGISSYKSLITNNTDKDITISNLYVVFHQNKEKIEVLALKDIKLKPSDSTYIKITSETNLSKTTKIEYIMK